MSPRFSLRSTSEICLGAPNLHSFHQLTHYSRDSTVFRPKCIKPIERKGMMIVKVRVGIEKASF